MTPRERSPVAAGGYAGTRLRIDPAHHRYLHELTDVLSSTLETPVMLTDENLALIAVSQHSAVDSARPAVAFSPERLALPPRALAGLTETTHAPGVPSIGMPGFWIVPLAVDERVVAFAWVVEHGAPLEEAQIVRVGRTASATMRALVRAGAFAESAEADAEHAAELMRDDPGKVNEAIARRTATGGFSHDGRTFALAIAAQPLNGHFATRAELSRVLGAIVDRAAAGYPAARRMVAQRGTEGVVLVAPFPRDDVDTAIAQVVGTARDLMMRSEPRELYGAWTLGMSDGRSTQSSPGEAAWQARQAAQLGLRVGWSRQHVDWSKVEQYRGISNLPEAFLHSHFLTVELERFLNSPEHADLADTLERFLFHAGNIQAIATERFLHRTTIYHRLRRIEEMLGVDLGRGHDRLELHMGVLAWRLMHRSIGPAAAQHAAGGA